MTPHVESGQVDAERINGAVRATEASFERALTTLRRASGTLERVIVENQRLATMPGHEASARQRIREARAELRGIRRQKAELERLMARFPWRDRVASEPQRVDAPDPAPNAPEGTSAAGSPPDEAALP
jgi:hypothetical protein